MIVLFILFHPFLFKREGGEAELAGGNLSLPSEH